MSLQAPEFTAFASQTNDSFDIALQVLFVVLVITLPILGYWLKYLDIRAYYRALRGMLVRVTNLLHHDDVPAWVTKDTPICITALGLDWPCTESEVRAAYHKLAEKNHPDLGGDRQRFLYLQQHFEQALRFIREQS